MKAIMTISVAMMITLIFLTSSCGGGCTKEHGITTEEVTICECENLFWDYSDKKEKAKTEKERIELSKEELKKNIMCYKLEESLGSKLEDERAKCN